MNSGDIVVFVSCTFQGVEVMGAPAPAPGACVLGTASLPQGVQVYPKAWLRKPLHLPFFCRNTKGEPVTCLTADILGVRVKH